MKSATNAVVGSLVEVRGSASCSTRPAVHHRDPVGHRQRLLLVVGDVDEGRPGRLLDPLQLELHLVAQLQVEGAERLVEEQRRGSVDERAGRGRRAGAGRRRAAPGVARRVPRAGRSRASRAIRWRRSRRGRRSSAGARSRRCRPRSCGGTARSPGRPCSRCVAAASRVTSSPASRTRPWSGSSKPAIIRRVVVLPQPLGPSSEKNSPAPISSETSSTASSSPKLLVTASRTIIGWLIARLPDRRSRARTGR